MDEEEKNGEPQAEALFIPIRDAARMLGVSERSVYGYMEEGSLPGFRARSVTVLRKEDVLNYRRKAPGRARTRTPAWHEPPVMNPAALSVITVQVLPGHEEQFAQKMEEIRRNGRHHLVGTAARYLARCVNGTEVQIVLIWRGSVMPPEDERQAALAAFFADLEEFLDWPTAACKESIVVMHA